MATPPTNRSRRRAGASESRAGLTHRLRSWLRHHRRTLVDSLQRLVSTPAQSLMTLLVIAIALALPAALYSAVDNLSQVARSIEVSASMTLFVDKDAGEEQVDDLMSRLEAHDDVASLRFISRERALEEFRADSGFGDALRLLDENPLPAAVLVQPEPAAIQVPGRADALAEWLAQQPLVDDVTVDLAWLSRFHALLATARDLVLGLAAVLGLGVVLVMGNTVRLAIQNRREEIVVVKLIGGTDSYVRRPFLYSGLWFGLGGGLLAWGLVWLGVLALDGEVRRLASLYQSGFDLRGPGLGQLLALLAGGGLLGLGGAWLAVSGQLKTIEPE